ncbi:unnamed protein product [Microthlaspi erraticum]|uniref:Uncharacterized protein n=1 Tax=Microthlaspi erraticum TaxID=1685480 RepID=A0A6D2J7E5_9BRAS|nr:unnamed protein product [Microthlaspi erraticum]
MNWKVATDNWEKLPKLTALDVSRTSIDHIAVSWSSIRSCKGNLSVNAKVAKAVAEEGGISVLAGLAKSMKKLLVYCGISLLEKSIRVSEALKDVYILLRPR